MYYTTGFCSGEIKELCALVAEIQSSIPPEGWVWVIQWLSP
jgi:hypothetical protein